MKKTLLILSAILMAIAVQAKNYSISTPNTTLIVTATEGKPLLFRYYGTRAEMSDIFAAGRTVKQEAYPAYGTYCEKPFASLVKQHDGDNAVNFVVEKVEQGKRRRGYGRQILIDHKFGYKTRYAHLSARFVKAGDEVIRGQIIGEVLYRFNLITGTDYNTEKELLFSAAGNLARPYQFVFSVYDGSSSMVPPK